MTSKFNQERELSASATAAGNEVVSDEHSMEHKGLLYSSLMQLRYNLIVYKSTMDQCERMIYELESNGERTFNSSRRFHSMPIASQRPRTKYGCSVFCDIGDFESRRYNWNVCMTERCVSSFVDYCSFNYNIGFCLVVAKRYQFFQSEYT